jgi:hypothetical protein
MTVYFKIVSYYKGSKTVWWGGGGIQSPKDIKTAKSHTCSACVLDIRTSEKLHFHMLRRVGWDPLIR